MLAAGEVERPGSLPASVFNAVTRRKLTLSLKTVSNTTHTSVSKQLTSTKFVYTCLGLSIYFLDSHLYAKIMVLSNDLFCGLMSQSTTYLCTVLG